MLNYSRTFLLAALMGFSGLCALHVVAQESTFELDPAKSQIEYSVSSTLHTVYGKFQIKSGTVHFNPGTGVASGLILVDATSGNSGNEGRDRKMHKEVLESDKFPDITFIPTKVTGQVSPEGDSSVQVEGTFRLHGSDHPISVAIPLHVNQGLVTANYRVVVPYVAWGLKNPSNFFLRVSDKVDVNVVAVGHLTQSVAQH
ncbi:MAG TPA: YceI family protein [Terriglobales bacterium]|nr:YceI family protein [Terriglobales bacterium]